MINGKAVRVFKRAAFFLTRVVGRVKLFIRLTNEGGRIMNTRVPFLRWKPLDLIAVLFLVMIVATIFATIYYEAWEPAVVLVGVFVGVAIADHKKKIPATRRDRMKSFYLVWKKK